MILQRIWALLMYDFNVINGSRWRQVETFYYPITSLIVWGLFAVYVQSYALEAALTILVVQIFWNFSYLSQSTVSSQMMEDIWSGSLKELLNTPLRPYEFLIARCIVSALRSFLTFAILMIGAYFFLNLSFIATNFTFVLILAVLSLFSSMGLGILVSAMVIRAGAEYGFLSWTVMEIFIVLSAPFYPMTIFPEPILSVSKAMPYTWIFESIKSFLASNQPNQQTLIYATIVSVIYFIMSFPIFLYVYESARRRGKLIRLWS